MRRTPLVVLLLIALLAPACASPEVQPKRSLRELYEVQAEVNESAEPYDLGTGAAPGRINHDRAAGER